MNRSIYKVLLALLLLGGFSAGRAENFQSIDAAKKPFSVPLSQLEERINSDPFASGAEFKIRASGRILRVDLVSIPGETSVAAVMRCIFMIGRLGEEKYDEMRFSDGGTDTFLIAGEKIREIGEQFLWGEEGGQNPIHLLRLFADSLRYPDGSRVIAPLTGSLLGDTSRSINAINDIFHKNWTLENTILR